MSTMRVPVPDDSPLPMTTRPVALLVHASRIFLRNVVRGSTTRAVQVFREDGLISPSPNFGLDWFEGAIAKPDAVLKDFYTAFHPTVQVRR